MDDARNFPPPRNAPSQQPDRLSDNPMTRIDHDVVRIKSITERVIVARSRIIYHAKSLGYYDPAPTTSAGPTPTPIVATLSDALTELDRELDHLSGALNFFD